MRKIAAKQRKKRMSYPQNNNSRTRRHGFMVLPLSRKRCITPVSSFGPGHVGNATLASVFNIVISEPDVCRSFVTEV